MSDNYEKTIALPVVKTIAQFVLLSAVVIFLPFFIHLQALTGSIVNAILIITLFLVGIRSALVVALVPSLMALAGGLLPVVLAPTVPFIMISNVILILTVDFFYQKAKSQNQGYWLGVMAGAGLKFLFLLFSVNFIVKILSSSSLAPKVAQMMSWPQFATAITGGLIAWAVLKWLKRI